MKTLLVACGNGIATSTMVSMKLKEAFRKEGIKANIIQCKLMEIPSKAEQADLIVTTGKYGKEVSGIPIINAMSLLTGIGQDETIQEIISYLK